MTNMQFRTAMPEKDDKKIHMLIVEDDPDVGTALQDFFELQGIRVQRVMDGEEALERIKNQQPSFDIVLLDVMLPRKNGFEVLRESQEMGIDSAVLMLTGRGEQENVLKGFGLGALDYVTKPFDAEELAARVRAILNRTMSPSEKPMEIYQIGDVKVNFSTHEVWKQGEKIHFTALEFDLLRYLLQYRGQTVTRKQLLSAVWGIDQDIATRTIDRHMASVRQKIEPTPADPKYIETVYGLGYRFNA